MKKNSWGNRVLFTGIAAISFYAHAYTILVLFGQFIILIHHQILMREDRRILIRRSAGFLCSCILATALYLPWLFYSFHNAKGQSPPTIDFRLFRMIIKELADGSYPLAFVLIICVAAGILCLFRTGRPLQLGILLIWLLSPIPLILIILSWRNYFFAVRQLIFITPAMIILTAIGIDYLKQKVSRRYFRPEVLVILISIAVILLHYPDKRDDFVSASQFLERNVRQTDIIIAPSSAYIFCLYFPEINRYIPGRDSTRNLTAVRGDSRIYFVETRFEQNRDALIDLLNSLPEPEQIKFRGITIYVF